MVYAPSVSARHRGACCAHARRSGWRGCPGCGAAWDSAYLRTYSAWRVGMIFLALFLMAGLAFAARPGVGVPDPPGGLPWNWTAQWCPQLRPQGQGEWAGHADAVRAGFDWKTQCPQRGWQGWFAEYFPCTEAAICLGWEADLFGTRATHTGNLRREHGRIICNYSLRDFHIAEVYWDRSHPAYQLMYALDEFPCKAGSTPADQLPIPVGQRVLRLSGDQWVADTVKVAGRQIVEFASGVRMTVGDEDRKWRRVTGETPPPPPTPVCGDGRIDPGETCATCPADQPSGACAPPPPPTCCPAGEACSAPCPPLPPWPAECLPEAGMDEHFRVIKERMLGVRQSRRDAADACYRALKRTYGAPAGSVQ